MRWDNTVHKRAARRIAMKRQYLMIFAYIVIIIWTFKSWFMYASLSSGDWDYQYRASLQNFSLLPYSWDTLSQNGLGGNVVYLLPLLLYYHATIFLLFNIFQASWVLIERIAWYWPYLILSFFSMFFLSRKIFRNMLANCLAGFIFLSNTYILMIVGGGQMGYAIGYSLAPFVLERFITTDNLFDNAENIKYQISNSKNAIKKLKLLNVSIINGLVLSLLLLFDIRVTYITVIAVIVYFVIQLITAKFNPRLLIEIVTSLAISGLVTVFLHAFWLLPLVVTKQNPVQEVGAAYTSIGSVKFFSFAAFENTLGLLHPNWPENIFGKVGFMKPEFLVLPLLAFGSLLFIKKSNSKNQIAKIQIKIQKFNNNETIEQWNNKAILYFALLALTGAFLAKGVNEPFGKVYLWLFQHVPGFVMFRDPTKWYVLIALAYSVLIPFSLYKISNFQFQIFKFKSKKESYSFLFILYSLFFIFWLFLIRQSILRQLNGTFATHSVPQEYTRLERMLSSDPRFYRTLWVPTKQRYGFSSPIHPTISAENFFQTSNANTILKKLQNRTTINILRNASIRYIIVPDDSEKEIYLKDRTYNESLHTLFINGLQNNRFITFYTAVGNIKLYSLSQNKDLFWLSSTQGAVSYQKMDQGTFSVAVDNGKLGEKVVFSESYDPQWKAEISNMYPIISSKYELFNSFILPKNGNYTMTVYYQPQQWVNIGLLVSGISFCIVIILIALISFYKKII